MTLSAFTGLSKRQQAMIPVLLSQPSIRAAAQHGNVQERTIYRWLQDPGFQAAYRDARYLVMDEAFVLLQKHCSAAAQVFIDMMHNDEALPFTRLKAAEAVLNTALKGRSIYELEQRLAELEGKYSLVSAASNGQAHG
jgi:hypothetical protein